MPTRKREPKTRALACVAVVCLVVIALAVPTGNGWAYADTSLGMRVYDSKQTPGTGDGTLLGIRVKAPTYTITWKANGGAWSGGSTADKTTSVVYGAATSAPENPTLTGYTLAGWSQSSTGTASTLPAQTTAAATWFAVWSANSYTVTFKDFNNQVISSLTYTYGQTIQKPANPTRASTAEYDYTFARWTPEVSATCTNNATYTATYTETKRSYTVSFNTNGGSEVAAQTVTYGAAASAPADPTKTGYGFVGWYTDAALTNAYHFDTPITGNTVLYAKWAVRIICNVPTAAIVSVDATGEVTGTTQPFVSSSVEPLNVTAVTSTQQPGAVQLFANAATLSGARVTLAPSGDASQPVKVPLSTAPEGVATNFLIPKQGTLQVTFGLELPQGAQLTYAPEARSIASLTYVVAVAE